LKAGPPTVAYFVAYPAVNRFPLGHRSTWIVQARQSLLPPVTLTVGLAEKNLFGKGYAERSVLLHMNFELSWWNIAEAEHRAPDRFIRGQSLLAFAGHCEARPEFFAVTRLQPALPRPCRVKSIAQDLKEKCVSFGIVGFSLSNKMSQLI